MHSLNIFVTSHSTDGGSICPEPDSRTRSLRTLEFVGGRGSRRACGPAARREPRPPEGDCPRSKVIPTPEGTRCARSAHFRRIGASSISPGPRLGKILDMDPDVEASLKPLLAGYPVAVALPVLWGDQDTFHHVNNVVYFRWFETARIAYNRRVGLMTSDKVPPIGPILAATSSSYRRQITEPDTVHVAVRVVKIGRTSLGLEHIVVSQAVPRHRRGRGVDGRRLRLSEQPASPGARRNPSRHRAARGEVVLSRCSIGRPADPCVAMRRIVQSLDPPRLPRGLGYPCPCRGARPRILGPEGLPRLALRRRDPGRTTSMR